MIWAFTGKTGSGKTYRMVKAAYKEWRKGRDIYSNTVLNFKAYDRYPRLREIFKRKANRVRGRIIYFEDITEILEVRDGLIIFDEAAALFDARNWEALPREFSQKLRQHRKHSLDLYCTTQNMGTIDINYRRLVQRWLHCTNRIKWGEGRVKIGLFKIEEKDVDRLYNTVDDLMCPSLGQSHFLIHYWSRPLYDTLYDIGFRRFRSELVWLGSNDPQSRKFSLAKSLWLIAPKDMNTQSAFRVMQSYRSLLDPSRSRTSRTG